jgi:penicillin-binding protein 1A
VTVRNIRPVSLFITPNFNRFEQYGKMAKKASNNFLGKARLLWLIALTPVFLIILILIAAMLSGLPDVDLLANPKVSLASQVVSADGKTLGAYYKENRSDAKFSELPPHLVNALLATEDVRYREHSGVDYWGLFRAVFTAGQGGGGSTITQQLAKMQFTKEYQNVSIFKRVFQKLREWIIACQIERLYTKDEIIALYFNQYDFLNQAVGIKSASYIYFNTTPDSLNIQQSAMLVGMLKNSSLYNPLKRDSLVMKRREVVLDQMVKYNFLSESAYDSLRILPLGIDFQRMSHDEGLAPYFREVLRSELETLLGQKDSKGNYLYAKADGQPYDIYRDGLKIFTTIDTRMQEHAEWAVHEHLKKELQPAFTRDVARRKPENYPFYNGISQKSRESIMKRAVESSERYLLMTGKLCPDCNRPEFYITREQGEDGEQFHCQESKQGCGHKWPVLSEETITQTMQKPVKMKVYSIYGPIDTLLSPIDSIKYIKSILHASVMSMDPHTGHVKCWVGGIDFKQFKFDNVYQSARQVGSTFKPLVYATALRMGKSPKDPVDGSHFCWGRWCPQNSGGGYGTYTMRCALANSVNTVAARLAQQYGLDNVIGLARRLGISGYLDPVGPLALGAANIPLFQMVGALGSFANEGVYIKPTFLLRIEDKNGTPVFESEPTVEQALDPCAAFEMLTIMKAVVDGSCGSGTAVRLRNPGKAYGGIPYPTAGKTGTTQNNTDGWFIGLTPDLVTGVWVGAQDPTVRFSSTAIGQGANTGLPIYGYYMKKVYADERIKISKEDFTPPRGCEVRDTPTVVGMIGVDEYDGLFGEGEESTDENQTELPGLPRETQEYIPSDSTNFDQD